MSAMWRLIGAIAVLLLCTAIARAEDLVFQRVVTYAREFNKVSTDAFSLRVEADGSREWLVVTSRHLVISIAVPVHGVPEYLSAILCPVEYRYGTGTVHPRSHIRCPDYVWNVVDKAFYERKVTDHAFDVYQTVIDWVCDNGGWSI